MGTPVSKSVALTASDKTSGLVDIQIKYTKETPFVRDNDETTGKEKTDGSNADEPISSDTENDVTQMLCAADDENNDDQDWGDIYKRLKTNINNDLHILNTRFNRNEVQAFRDNSVKATDPISTVAERPTRINSAYNNPHDVGYDKELSRAKSANCNRAEILEEDSSENEDSESRSEEINKYDILPSAQSKERDDPNCVNVSENKKSKGNTIDIIETLKVDADEGQTIIRGGNNLMVPDITRLHLPNDRRLQSPAPKSHENDNPLDDDDIDPFEGLDIPRKRAYSFGSSSTYSVMEISDDLYQQYHTEIKNCIRSYGFFEAFPSPSIVSEAQKIYRRLDMPSPVDGDGNVLPHPPKVTKSEYLAEETLAFDEAREKIKNMPEKLLKHDELVDIVHYLCDGIDDDMRKLIMISAWMVFKQLQKDDRHCEKQEEWCRQFRIMCKFARIKTKLVNGIIRGKDFVPGDTLDSKRGHWLAVLVNYIWLLVDPCIQRKQERNTKTNFSSVNDIDSNLFDYVEQMFQDPEDFIFSHYPDEEHWQLLARPVTKEELPELAVLRPGFVAFGMTILNSPKSVIVAKTSETLVSLAFQGDKVLQFSCDFQICDKSISLAHPRTYVFLETILKSHKVNVRVRFPRKGSYILNISGSAGDHIWHNIISYKLVYDGETFSQPFPVNPREEWGPGMESYKLGLTSLLYHSGEILMQKGVIQIAFHADKILQFEHLLTKEDTNISPESLKVSTLKDKNNDVIFVVDVETKTVGVFTLQLSAREDHTAEYTNFCNYLIRKEKTMVVPKLKFSENSFSTEQKDTIHALENGTLLLTVDTSGLIQLNVELKLHARQELNLSDHTRHWICENSGYIDVNFPRMGKYTLQVLGREINNGRFRKIREETVQVDLPSAKWSCFPKIGNNWNSWYKTESPLSHHLKEKEDATFKVNIMNALDVAVHGAGGWYHLDRVDESWLWIGQVRTGPKATRCSLLARFDVGSDKWSDLLHFKIMSEEDFENMEERQVSAREQAFNEKKVGTN